jgi:hypothetical protein
MGAAAVRPINVNPTKPAWAALALFAVLPLAARAAGEPALDGSVLAPVAQPVALMRRDGGAYPAQYGRYYRPQARQGLLVSFGLGGGSLYLSNEGGSRIGAADFDFRLGYGFSDRFQMFMDFNTDQGTTYRRSNVGSWTWTVRAQTVLVGDRAGNGLNVNFGAGLGGLTYGRGYYGSSSPTGFALGGGLSYDARITPWMALSPEFFVTWHQIPNQPGLADDVSSMYGARLSLLWYLH